MNGNMVMKTVKFTANVKKKWLRALRNGDFKQGKEYLKREVNQHSTVYCCLGVLQRITGIRSDSNILLEKYSESTNTLAPSTAIEGLSIHEQLTLGEMNDHKGASFQEIADYIEKNIPALDN